LISKIKIKIKIIEIFLKKLTNAWCLCNNGYAWDLIQGVTRHTISPKEKGGGEGEDVIAGKVRKESERERGR
jgi:hypothetical protein